MNLLISDTDGAQTVSSDSIDGLLEFDTSIFDFVLDYDGTALGVNDPFTEQTTFSSIGTYGPQTYSDANGTALLPWGKTACVGTPACGTRERCRWRFVRTMRRTS